MLSQKKRVLFQTLVFLFVVLIDVYFRFYCRTFSCEFVVGSFGVEYFQNHYLAFGFQASIFLTYFFTGLVVSLFLFLGFFRLRSGDGYRYEAILYIFIAGFGLVNFLDRLLFGYVADYIRILNGYFNLADFGVLLLLCKVIFGDKIWFPKYPQQR